MIRCLFTCCFILLSMAGLAQGKTKKAVFVIVDGIAADVIEKLDPPNLRKIAAIGGFARTIVGGEKGSYSQTPTISAVGYNSVLTGTWVNKHNVWDNDIVEPNYHYPTIFRLLKTQYPEKKIGIFSSWLDNRTKLVGDEMKETGNIAVDYKFDGLELDTISYPHDKQRDFMHRIDEKVAGEAAATIHQKAPDLSWVYLEYTDDMGHMHGDSPEFHKAIGYADQQIGRIWEAIDYRQKHFNEEWMIVITTDHGRDSITGHNHGGQSNRERSGWIVTNARNLNEYFKRNQSAMVDIMPSIAKFMNINVPIDIAREVDGIPLIGPVSFTGLSAIYTDGKADLKWNAQQKTGTAKIWIATTNHFKTGGKDDYHLVAEVPLSFQHATINLQKYPSTFYKIVVEAKHNRMSRWIIVTAK